MIRHATGPAIGNVHEMEIALNKNIVYHATVTSKEKEETYVELTPTTFKARLANQKQWFRSESKRAQTELSKYVGALRMKTRTLKSNGTFSKEHYRTPM